MKILKYLLFIILGLIAIVFIAALILPKTFHAEGNTVINRPVADVYNYVKQIKTQEQYSFFFLQDPNIKTEYYGTDGTVGGGLKWKSKKMGDGEQKIAKLTENQRVDIDLYLMDGSEPNQSYYILESQGDNQTKVKIGVDGKTPIPFNIMSACYDMDKDFQETANNLKKVLEK